MTQRRWGNVEKLDFWPIVCWGSVSLLIPYHHHYYEDDYHGKGNNENVKHVRKDGKRITSTYYIADMD